MQRFISGTAGPVGFSEAFGFEGEYLLSCQAKTGRVRAPAVSVSILCPLGQPKKAIARIPALIFVSGSSPEISFIAETI